MSQSDQGSGAHCSSAQEICRIFVQGLFYSAESDKIIIQGEKQSVIYNEKGDCIMSEKRRRRFGDRKEGRKIRSLDPINTMSAYIMKDRVGSTNYIRDSVEISKVEKYIIKKRKEGLMGFGMLHILIATYVRTVSQMPGINRFIGGQKIYARNNIEICLAIKKEMTLDAMETIIKIECDPSDTVYEIYEKLKKEIETNRAEGDISSFDSTARFLNYIPGLLMKFVMVILRIMDYLDLLPRFLTKLSPFHGSLFITSMGSLGIPPIFHHLYDFGNVPLFMAYGTKRRAYELQKDGTVAERRYIDYTVSSDERICDGFYFASAMKFFKDIFKKPEILDNPPEVVIEDID